MDRRHNEKAKYFCIVWWHTSAPFMRVIFLQIMSTCKIRMSTCKIRKSTCKINMSTCKIKIKSNFIMSTCKIFMSTCKILMSTCKIIMSTCKIIMSTCKIIRIYHDFVQGQGNPPECRRFAVHDEACRVVDVANL